MRPELPFYLPSHLVRELSSRGAPATLPETGTFPAALLSCDVSGFTALTESLQRGGREGAEQIGELMTAAFGPVLDEVAKQRGSVISFGGDGVFALFRGSGGPERGLLAARGIERIFAGELSLPGIPNPVTLKICQALHWGRVKALTLGTEQQYHYLVTGPSVTALAREQERAKVGQVRQSASLRRRLALTGAEELSEDDTGDSRLGILTNGREAPHFIARFLPSGTREILGRLRGEYRRVVVLFLQTRGWSGPSLQKFYLSLLDVLHRFQGLLIKSDLSPTGNQWLCAFGLPAVHEDDADRAAHAALELRAQLPSRLQFRGGLNGGIVVNVEVRGRKRRFFDLMGDTVNTAARIMTRAQWGEIWLDRETGDRLIQLETSARGAHRLKGKASTRDLVALTGQRRSISTGRSFSPLVGRQAELETLRRALVQAESGQGQAVLISGPAGIGKSRLALELVREARERGFGVHQGQALSFGIMPYWSVGLLLRSSLQLEQSSTPERIWKALEKVSLQCQLSSGEMHHLADIMGVRATDSPLADLEPQAVRLNNRLTLLRALLSWAERSPQLLVFEDLQWVDESSLDCIRELLNQAASSRILVLMLARPSARGSISQLTGYQEVSLSELGESQIRRLLGALLGREPRRDELQPVLTRSAGNPFYVEELARHLQETSSSDSPAPDSLPESIERLIAARLDRLSQNVRHVAQLGSVIGRSFLLRLLASLEEVGAEAEGAVQELLSRSFVDAKLLEPEPEYIFHHALTREVIYGTILVRHRVRLHRAVAEAFEQLFPDRNEMFQAWLGHHWERAQDHSKARLCYLRAARQATARHALDEAEQLFRASLSLFPKPTEDSVRARWELAGRVLAVRGRGSEALQMCDLGLEEARELGDGWIEARLRRQIGVLHQEAGRMEECGRWVREALTQTRELGDRAGEGLCLQSLSFVHYIGGDRAQACHLLEQSLEALIAAGPGPGIATTMSNLALFYHESGRISEAQALIEKAIAHARQREEPYNEGLALGNQAMFLQEAGRLEDATRLYREAIARFQRIGHRRFVANCRLNLANVYRLKEQDGQALDLFEQALAGAREVADLRLQALVLSNSADLLREAGRIDESRERYRLALAHFGRIGDTRAQAVTSRGVARLERQTGSLKLAIGQAARSLRLLEQLHDQQQIALSLCEQGYLALARGRDPHRFLQRARSLAEVLGAQPKSELGQNLVGLERAIEFRDRGRPLHRGEPRELLPAGLSRWLQQHSDRL